MKTGGIEVVACDSVGWIMFDRAPLNILNATMARAITDAVRTLDCDPRIKILCLVGKGERAFMAGADVAEHTLEKTVDLSAAMFELIETLVDPAGKPRIAAVKGYCSGGGCELAFSCDFIVARDDARFSLPEINIGMVNALAANLMSRVAHPNRALEFAMTGEWFDAKSALELGFINHLWERSEFEINLDKYLAKFTRQSGPVLRLGRRIYKSAMEQSKVASLAPIHREVISDAMLVDDYAEGVSAFLEKRAPKWKMG
jgi:enoyl-CoA hydratase/carnithine racemase